MKVTWSGWSYLFCGLAVAYGMTAERSLTADDEKGDILLADLEKRFRIVGVLGKHLRTPMTVRGMWTNERDAADKPSLDLQFIVTHLDGKKLETPIAYEQRFVVKISSKLNVPEKRHGTIWEIRCSEDLNVGGLSGPVAEEMGIAHRSSGRVRHFESELRFYRCEEVND